MIVVGTLGLVFAWRVDRAIRIAYDSHWVVRGTTGARLSTETWKEFYVGVGFASVMLLIWAAFLWRRRERGSYFKGKLGVPSVVISALAFVLAIAAGVRRWQAADGAGAGVLTSATVVNGLALAAVAALALATGNLVYERSGGLIRVFKGVFQRQRMNLVVVLALTVALMFIGETSGQSIDSIRSWSPYVFGSEDPWSSGLGTARLMLGLAAALMFSLAIYESGSRLTHAQSSTEKPKLFWLVFAGAAMTVGGLLVFALSLPLGPGLLLAGVMLLLIALLELPNLDRAASARESVSLTGAEMNAPEWIAITPLLTLAATSVTATVEAALSAGARDWNARLTLAPALVLGALAVLLTRRRPKRPLGVGVVGFLFLTVLIIMLSLGVLFAAVKWSEGKEWIMAAYGAVWLATLTGYAFWLFHRDREAEAAPGEGEPQPATDAAHESESQPATEADPAGSTSEPKAATEPDAASPEGGHADLGASRGSSVSQPETTQGRSIPVVLGPVALGGGIAVFIGIHVRPLDAGRLLGVFTLVLVAFAFALPFLHLAVRATLRLRPPRLLWWFGFSQLPVLTLLLIWWIAVGMAQTHLGSMKSLHDVRLIERPTADLEAKAAGKASPPLEQFFNEWIDAQEDLPGKASDGPVPMVLVAAHGGGIRAAYWTAAALDCIVGVSAAGVDPADLESRDESVRAKVRDEACDSSRRDTDEQRSAARRIFMASGVSGGAVGLYAYARQLLHNGQLGSTDWVDARLGGDFASPAIGWALFHDIPNRLFGLHPALGAPAPCNVEFKGVCLTQDRAAVLEETFDDKWERNPSSLAQLRRAYDLRFAVDADARNNARLLPLLAMNATLTGGKARAVISAADLGSWPRADADSPERGDDSLPLAGTVEIRDALCESRDIRLSTAALLAARFPYVTPSGRIPGRCGYDGKLQRRDEDARCANADPEKPKVRCEGRYVDGGYTDNSGLFTLVAVWPSLRARIVEYNVKARDAKQRQIAPMIVELDNHYQASLLASVPSGGSAAETLIPPQTAFGGRSSIETYAHAAAYRILPVSCTLTVSPALHPGLIAPLGWELSEAARADLRAGLTNPHGADPTGMRAVTVLRQVQARLAAPTEQKVVIGEPLKDCLPRLPPPPAADLDVVKTADRATLRVGGLVKYMLTVSNLGPGTATNVGLVDRLGGPARTIVSVTPSQGSCTSAAPVECALGDIAAGARVTVTLVVRARAGGTLTNRATATSDTPDPVAANGSSGTRSTLVLASGTLRLIARELLIIRRLHAEVSCRLTGGPLRSCAVAIRTLPRAGNRVLASGTERVGWAGSATLRVRLRLTPFGRSLLNQRLGGVAVNANANAISTGGERRWDAERIRAIIDPESVRTPPAAWVPDEAVLTAIGRRFFRSLRGELIAVRRVICEGHTARITNPLTRSSINLSRVRARVACARLRALGVRAPASIVFKGGIEPIANNATEAGRRRNRRVEVVLRH